MNKIEQRCLLIRPYSGISGDMMLSGLAAIAGFNQDDLNNIIAALNLPELVGRVFLSEKQVNHISGHTLIVDLEPSSEHRHLSDININITNSNLSEKAKKLAISAFEVLAIAEAQVHNVKMEEIHFHEAGSLDSILDIAVSAAIFDYLQIDSLFCGPLPICDGIINCQHGILPSPAPAVLKMLEGAIIKSYNGEGETVTPTGLALLKAFEAKFDSWPSILVLKQAQVYGSKVFKNSINGAAFILGDLKGIN